MAEGGCPGFGRGVGVQFTQKGSQMTWLRIKRAFFALLCSGFLLDYGCPTETDIQKAASNAGQTLTNDLVKVTVKKWFDALVGLN